MAVSSQIERTREELLSKLDDLARLLSEVRELVIDDDPKMIRKANGDD